MAVSSIGSRLTENVQYNCELGEFNLGFLADVHEKAKSNSHVVIKDTDFESVEALHALILSSGAKSVIFDGFFQRLALYRKREFYLASIFRRPNSDPAPIGENEILIHIRAGDILNGDHPLYPLVPVRFYQELIERTGYSPVFIGQLEDREYMREILRAFPRARTISPEAPLTDFNRIRQAQRICISVSTFSWLAAWLSDATEIHYPLLGMLHPFSAPKGRYGLGGVDLTPIDDPRYRFHLLPIINAQAETEYLRFTSPLEPISRPVSADLARQLSQIAKTTPEIVDTATPASYFRRFVDAAWSVAEGRYRSAEEHFLNIGRSEGYYETEIGQAVDGSPNIALGKSATQSSVSPWSKHLSCERDASGAVDGFLDGDYAFHTEIEDNPWWRVDLGGDYEISRMRIYNRDSEPQLARRASELAIDVGSTEEDYVEIFRLGAEPIFGGSSRGNPLVVEPKSRILGRFVRIRLIGRQCLHLEQVAVFGRLARGQG